MERKEVGPDRHTDLSGKGRAGGAEETEGEGRTGWETERKSRRQGERDTHAPRD